MSSLPALTSLARPTGPGAISLAQVAHLFSEGDEQLSLQKAVRTQRREALFRETLPQSLRRSALGMAYATRAGRLSGLAPMWRLLAREALVRNRGLPDPAQALASPDGLCGMAADLSVPTLREAYAKGLFPWCHAGPVKWWAPRTRCVADPGEVPMGKRARRHAASGALRFTFDRDFDTVIAACAGPRTGRLPLTWITPKIMWAFAALHDAGFAHSYEVWDAEGQLVAGGYGVAAGSVFVGESMFTRASGAGAFGMAMLHRHLVHWGFALHDAKLPTPHFVSLGFTEMPREEYATYLGRPVPASFAGRWQALPRLCTPERISAR